MEQGEWACARSGCSCRCETLCGDEVQMRGNCWWGGVQGDGQGATEAEEAPQEDSSSQSGECVVMRDELGRAST